MNHQQLAEAVVAMRDVLTRLLVAIDVAHAPASEPAAAPPALSEDGSHFLQGWKHFDGSPIVRVQVVDPVHGKPVYRTYDEFGKHVDHFADGTSAEYPEKSKYNAIPPASPAPASSSPFPITSENVQQIVGWKTRDGKGKVISVRWDEGNNFPVRAIVNRPGHPDNEIKSGWRKDGRFLVSHETELDIVPPGK